MTLHKKTFLIIGIALISLIAALYSASSLILLRGFALVERQAIEKDVRRAREALTEDLHQLEIYTNDYAIWDDTYHFINNHSPEYIDSNFASTTFLNGSINAVFFIDRQSRIVFAQAIDLDTRAIIPVPPSWNRLLTPGSPLLARPADQGVTGLMLLPEGPILVSAQPILKNEGQGPVNGTLIMGRYLNEAELRHLSEITHLSLHLLRMDDDPASWPADFTSARPHLTASDTIATQPLQADRIAGYTRLDDLAGHPILLLRVDTGRPIYAQGQTSLGYLGISLVLLSLGFIALVGFLLDRLILRRLAVLNQAVNRIGAGGALSERVPDQGQDELDNLGQTINSMLEKLDHARKEQARVEETLRISENMYRALVEQIPAVIYLKAADPGSPLVYISPQIESLIGCPPDSWMTEPDLWFRQTHPDDRERLRAEIARVEASGEAFDLEYRLYTCEGQLRWVRDTAVIVHPSTGQSDSYWQGILVDITERKTAEQMLHRYTQELQARNEELDAFSHTVAHDLKNPLARIIGFAELVVFGEGSFAKEEVHNYLQIIRQSGFKMKSIIEELMLLSGIRKLSDLKLARLDMARVFDEARQRIDYLIEDSRAEINLPDDWPDALGYGPWVEEVWVNYLSNAIKYGGRPPLIEIGADTLPDGRVRYWVHDNGPGLTAQERERLFTPFTRLGQIRAEGHGLGLSIVRRIVEKLNGQVQVESSGNPGDGSIFSFTLPGVPDLQPQGAGALHTEDKKADN